jgi:hypothetical protein
MEPMGIAAGRSTPLRSAQDNPSPYFAEASALFSRALRRLAALR